MLRSALLVIGHVLTADVIGLVEKMVGGIQTHRLLQQALPSLFPFALFSLPHTPTPPLFASATRASSVHSVQPIQSVQPVQPVQPIHSVQQVQSVLFVQPVLPRAGSWSFLILAVTAVVEGGFFDLDFNLLHTRHTHTCSDENYSKA